MENNMREEFEKWFYDNTGLECEFDIYGSAFVTASPKTTGDTIANTSCNIAWRSWQASRAADKDASRYRWIKINVSNDDADFVLERPISEWDSAIDEVMNASGN